MKKQLEHGGIATVYFFLFLGVLLLPFPFDVFPFQTALVDLLFGDFLSFLGQQIEGLSLGQQGITSDSTTLYLLFLILFFLAVLGSIVLLFWSKWANHQQKVFSFIRIFLTYYLALLLVQYGLDKVFKAQFYLPEPNILYTPFGKISKDLLFWSTLGTSRAYNIFIGLLELIPALLLLFSRTRLLGLLIAWPVLTHVLVLNFSFDISVKLFSLFLWSIASFLLIPYLKSLFDFLIIQKATILPQANPILSDRPFYKHSLKAFAIGIILLEGLFPYVSTGQFNDDLHPRPYLHGAYEIIEATLDDQAVPIQSLAIKRFFIHRQGYFIYQNQKDQMLDYKLDIDLLHQQFHLTDYQQNQSTLYFQHQPTDSLLFLQYFQQDQAYWLKAKALNWRQLPALQNRFHWTIEGIE